MTPETNANTTLQRSPTIVAARSSDEAFAPARLRVVFVQDELAARIGRDDGGSIWAFREGRVSGWIASLTNQRVKGNISSALGSVCVLAESLVALNLSIREQVVIGWWRNLSGELFIDIGLALGDEQDAHALGRSFSQEEVAHIKPDGTVTTARVQRNHSPRLNMDGDLRWPEQGVREPEQPP
ncbi:MAG: hypothetical protein JNK58_03415 [Phycisphaerae bacterium]|nr:hypothetical protein [Phycisphaerae bacterium]